MKNVSLGRQLLVEFYDCCTYSINNLEIVREAMLEAAKLSRATIVNDVFHEFNPQGLSGVVVIAESHFAIHTWPEHGVASLDIFSCSAKMIPELGIAYLQRVFKTEKMKIVEVQRAQLTLSPAKTYQFSINSD